MTKLQWEKACRPQAEVRSNGYTEAVEAIRAEQRVRDLDALATALRCWLPEGVRPAFQRMRESLLRGDPTRALTKKQRGFVAKFFPTRPVLAVPEVLRDLPAKPPGRGMECLAGAEGPGAPPATPAPVTRRWCSACGRETPYAEGDRLNCARCGTREAGAIRSAAQAATIRGETRHHGGA